MNILVTAGPTREYLDPVRFLSNRSTGKMGFSVARAAAERGHTVTLVAGPVSLETPAGVMRTDVVSAREMLDALVRLLPNQDALVMTAAVADWRPARVSTVKQKKSSMPPTLELVPNPDILKTLRPQKGERVFVGFAAETGDPLPEASRKRVEKGLDLIVANDVSRPDAGFAVDTNRVTFLFAEGEKITRREFPLLTKAEVGVKIIEWLEAFSLER